MAGFLAKYELEAGRPLAHDLVDQTGKILLRAGHVITDPVLANRLVESGVRWYEGDVPQQAVARSQLRKRQESPPFERVVEISDELDRICRRELQSDGFPMLVRAIANSVIDVSDWDPDAILAAISLGSSKNTYSIRHQIDVALLVSILAKDIGLWVGERLSLVCAALTMNLGILEMQDYLHDFNGTLTPEQREVIRVHPESSVKMLSVLGVTDSAWLEAISSHHEALDGSGYPNEKVGDDISQFAQLLHLADMYTARIASRAWRQAEQPNVTLADVMSQVVNNHIRKDLGQRLVKSLGFFPPGTAVRLVNGEVAMVLRRGETVRTPIVASFFSSRGLPLGAPVQRDSSMERFAITCLVPREMLPLQVKPSLLWGYTNHT